MNQFIALLFVALSLVHVQADARSCGSIFLNSTSHKNQDLLSHQLELVPNSKGNVLLIHGLGDDISSLSSIAKDLKKSGYSILRIELNAHGQNLEKMVQGKESVPSTISYEQNSQDIIKLLHALKFKKPHIIGHSYGGAISYNIANNLKGEYSAQSLIMMAPYLRRLDHSLLTGNPVLDMQTEFMTEQYMRKSYRDYFQSLDRPHVDQLVDAAIATTKGIRNFDVLSYGKKAALKVKVPLLIIAGKKDEAITPESIEDFHQKLNKENYKHHLLFLDGDHFFPQRLSSEASQAIKEFFKAP